VGDLAGADSVARLVIENAQITLRNGGNNQPSGGWIRSLGVDLDMKNVKQIGDMDYMVGALSRTSRFGIPA
jgi:hypothetical protein